MAKIPPESVTFPGRGVSIKGQFYTRWVNGKLVLSKWPRSQPSARTAAEKDRRALLAKAARFTAYMSAGAQTFARDLAKESKLLPRDFLMIALFNRIGYVVTMDGRKIFSMPAVTDVSNLLDAIWQLKGGILIRNETWWTGLPLGNEGDLLTVGPDELPVWAPSSGGGGGGELFMAAPFLNPTFPGQTIGAGTAIVLPIIPAADVTLTGLRLWVTAAGSGRSVTAFLYADNGLTVAGAPLLAQSPAVPAATGILPLPLSPPVALSKNTLYWFGVLVSGGSGNLQAMQGDLTRNAYQYWSQGGSSVPSTAPAVTNGTGATQFNWWGY